MSTVDNFQEIESFVVLDVETTGFQGLRTELEITELCMYGFPATELKKKLNYKEKKQFTPPRVLRKLTLIFNPRRPINPNSTGIDDNMVKHETHFNENAAEMILSFLNAMPQPICIVCHSIEFHDVELLLIKMNKLQYELPIKTLVLDSIKTICKIDDPQYSDDKRVPKYDYRLKNIYNRKFEKEPEVQHHAEADVETLMRVMQEYGETFLVYAKRFAKPVDLIKV